jgi:hypothetical protein
VEISFLHLTKMTPEPVRRHVHERLYQLRIHSRWIRELHRISEQSGEPITVLIDQALQEFVSITRQEPTARAAQEPGEDESISHSVCRRLTPQDIPQASADPA